MQVALLEIYWGKYLHTKQVMMDNQVEELLVVDDHMQPPPSHGVVTAADII